MWAVGVLNHGLSGTIWRAFSGHRGEDCNHPTQPITADRTFVIR